MTKPTGNKRGRPRKLPEFMVRLGVDKEKWSKWLSSMGFPEHSSSKYEILEHILCEDGESAWSRIGEGWDDESATLTSNPWIAPFLKDDEDREVILPANWLRYLDYMDVVAEELSPKDKGAQLKKLVLEDARSRHKLRPPQFPTEIGSPAEFKKCLAEHELEIRKKFN